MSDAPLGQARPAQHASLADKLKPTDLGGMLAPTSRAPRPVAVPPIVDQPTEEATPEQHLDAEVIAEPMPAVEEQATPATKVTPKSGSSRAGRGSKVTAATAPQATETTPTGKADQPIQVSLPRSLMERLERFKKDKGLSHPTILFDAIESNADRLSDLVKARIVQVGGATGKSLFNRPQTVVPRSSDNEPKETFIIRVSQQNKDILDQLAQDAGAPSRTVLLVAAYDAYLPN